MMKIRHFKKSREPVSYYFPPTGIAFTKSSCVDAKAKAELAAKTKGAKGPLNTGSQGIKKSGKK